MLENCTIAKLAMPAIERYRLRAILCKSCATLVPSKCWQRSIEESSAAALTAQRSSLLSRQLICASALRPFYSCATRPALVSRQESQRVPKSPKESRLRMTVKPRRNHKKKEKMIEQSLKNYLKYFSLSKKNFQKDFSCELL